MTDHDIFISYARRDDQPRAPGGEGWVTAFHRRLVRQHLLYSTRELKIFFDTHSIENGADWEKHIGAALKSSKLFLAFLSPNALASEWCRREWEEYLRLEHTLARGDDGVENIFFVEIPNLFDGPAEQFADSVREWVKDIRRRHHDHAFDLKPWHDAGPEQLRLIDAEERLAELRARPEDHSAGHLVKLAEQIAAIDRAIAKRLDRAMLAEFASGAVPNSYRQFVGRARELRALHKALVADKVGLVGALHGLGGQGKTALAAQYAYAYAEHYAAGGRWWLNCEGKTTLFAALTPLPGMLGCEEPRRREGESDSEFETRFLQTVVAEIERRMAVSAPKIAEWLATNPMAHARPEDQPEVERSALLILDNVDWPGLLSATQLAWLAERRWLHVIATTRLDPHEFGGLVGAMKAIPIDDLPPEDAFALLNAMWPIVGEREAEAARAIVARLGGFTLGIELIGAYLGASRSIPYAGFRDRLEAEGLPAVDNVGAEAEVADQIRYEHRQKQIGAILRDTIAGLSDAARETLAIAALFPPDAIVADWLRSVVATARPELGAGQVKPGYPDPWAALLADLDGRRLLPEGAAGGGGLPTLRMHRLVSEFILGEEPADRIETRWAAMLGLVDALRRVVEQNWDRAPLAMMPLIAPFGAVAEHVHRARANAVTARAISVLADCELQMGRFIRVGELMEAALAILRRLSDASPGDAQAARDLSVSLIKIGDFYLRRGGPGDAERALAAFEAVLATLRQLSDASPGDAQAARDLSVSLNKMGDFHLRRGGPGDAERALAAFEAALATRRQLSDASPGDAQAARDLSVSLNKMGDFYLRRGGPGDAERALAAFEEDLRIARQLSDASPGDAQAARDLSVSQERLGDFYLRRGGPGDAERALAAFEAALATSRQLSDASPGDAQAARDLSVSQERLGDFHLRRGGPGDAERALAAFEAALATRRQLSDASPGDAQAARDLSVSQERLGDFHLRRGGPGDAERALAAFEAALATRRQLSDASPGDAQAARDLSVSHFKIARLHESLGDASAERDADEAAFAITESFRREGRPMDPQMQQAHAWLRQKLGR